MSIFSSLVDNAILYYYTKIINNYMIFIVIFIKKGVKTMPNRVLLIKSSTNNKESISNHLSEQLVQLIQNKRKYVQVLERDLSNEEVPHLSQEIISAFYYSGENPTASIMQAKSRSEEYINELKESDLIILAIPMINFHIPSQLKSWIDQIFRAKITFKYTENGPVGLLENKKLVVVIASGGIHSVNNHDYIEPYIKHTFNFLGIQNITFVKAEGMNMPHKKDEMLAAAKAEIINFAHNL